MIITPEQKTLLLEKVCPLGRVPCNVGGRIEFTETTARRFINDGYQVGRRPKNPMLVDPTAYNPRYLGFGIREALSIIIQDDYGLYTGMIHLLDEMEAIALERISSSENAIMLFAHKSFGERLFPHIHTRSNDPSDTLSMFCNLTQTSEEKPQLIMFKEVGQGDRAYERGYTDHKVMMAHERRGVSEIVEIHHEAFVEFPAYKIPHVMTYTDDLWVVLVYDHTRKKTKCRPSLLPLGKSSQSSC